MNQSLTVYGAPGSGSVPVEAALTLIGRPFTVIEGATWEHDPDVLARVEAVNPLKQIPAVVLPSGEILTESGALLIWLADAHPAAKLGPALDDPPAHHWGRRDRRRPARYCAGASYSSPSRARRTANGP